MAEHSLDGKLTLALGVQTVRVVRLEPRTGRYLVSDRYVLHDCGRMLDPIVVDGQSIGCAVDGIGGAMQSEILYGDDGELPTGMLADYLTITDPEAPRVRCDHVTTIAPTDPLGVRGVGEGGIIGSAPAIVNALARMLGPERTRGGDALFAVPVRPETVLDLPAAP